MTPEQHELLSAYLDGEVSAAERAEVERLLASDAAARKALDDMRRISAMVGGLPRQKAPPGFAFGVASRLADGAARADTTASQGRKTVVLHLHNQDNEAGGSQRR